MANVSIVKYSLAEELTSAISHGIGFGLGIAGGVLCIVKAAMYDTAPAVVSSCIFAFTLILLYCMSTLYHSLSPKLTAKKVFRVIDHCCVFVLIAGTYTPYCLVALKGAHGWIMFGIIWGLCVLGVIFNAIDVDKYQVISAIINVIMGWAVVLEFGHLYRACGGACVAFLVIGGGAYTVGAILYGIGKKVKYMHSVFHFFVVAGSIMHFFSIYLYLL